MWFFASLGFKAQPRLLLFGGHGALRASRSLMNDHVATLRPPINATATALVAMNTARLRCTSFESDTADSVAARPLAHC